VPDGVGACAVGKSVCSSPNAEPTCESKPAAETCNGVDDDCDGIIDEDCKLTITLRDGGGATVVSAEKKDYPVGGRGTLQLTQLFGKNPGPSWAEITSASPLPVFGTAAPLLANNKDPHLLIPTIAPKSAAKSVVLPGYSYGGTAPGAVFSHIVDVVNLSDAPAAVTLTRTPEGDVPSAPQAKTIAPHGFLRTSVNALYSEAMPGTQARGALRIGSDQDVVVAYREERSDYADSAGDAAWAPPATALTIPLFMAGPSSNTLVRVSSEGLVDAPMSVRLVVPGELPLEAPVSLSAGTSTVIDLAALFPVFATTTKIGVVELSAAEPISAMAEVFEFVTLKGHALVGAVSGPDTVHYIDDLRVDSAGANTTVVFANPGDVASNVTLAAFAPDGAAGPKVTVVVGAKGSYVAALRDLLGEFTGWARITSDRPITGAYARYDAQPGLAVTALLRRGDNTAIVPIVEGSSTQITLIQPERRSTP
jgi:hypothetical protein